MKNILLVLSLISSLTLCGQQSIFKENIRKELRFKEVSANQTLLVKNISGSIEVEGHDGDQVIVEVIKTIKAGNEQDLETGKAEADLGVLIKEDVILLYMEQPCIDLDPDKVDVDQWRDGDNWNPWNGCNWNPDYHFQLDYTLKVPRSVALRLSTVNDGNISVRDVQGDLKVNNVNGAISLEQIAGSTDAHTINGDLTLRYAHNPSSDSKFYTLNGDIKAYFKPGLSAELYFKSFNGDLYIDIEEAQLLAPRLEQEKMGQGISYKVDETQGLRIRNGGVRLDVETFNGDAYIKEE